MSKPHGIDEIDLTLDSEGDDESEFCERRAGFKHTTQLLARLLSCGSSVTDEDDHDCDSTSISSESEKEERKAFFNGYSSQASNHPSIINLGGENAIHRWRKESMQGETGGGKYTDSDVAVIMSDHSSVAVELGSPWSVAVGDPDGGLGAEVAVEAEPVSVSGCAKVPPPSIKQRQLMDEQDVPVAGPSQVPIIRSTSVSPKPMEGPSYKMEFIQRPHLVHFASASSAAELRSAPNVWHELSHDGEHAGKRELSREVQEAQVTSLHNRGVAAMHKGHKWTAIDCFQRIFAHTAVRELCPTDWTTFDWAAARERWSECSHGKRLGDMQTVLLSTSMAMVELAENPIPFYLQALSIRPDATDLWFELGQCSTQSGLWKVAQFAFEQCGNQFRACEALLLLYFIQRDYQKCVPVLKEALSQCPDHLVGHVVRAELMREDPLSVWKGILNSCPLCPTEVDIGGSRERVLSKIDYIRQHAKAHSAQSTGGFKNPFIAESSASALHYQPLVVRIDSDFSIAGLGRQLCNVFDRIQEFSSQVAFECPSTSTQLNSMYGDSHGVLLGVASTEFELTPGMKRQLSARGAPLGVDHRVVGDLLEELVCICVDDLPSPLQPKIDVGGKGGREPIDRNEPAKRRRLDIDEADDALRRRRSTRFLENLDDLSTTTSSLPAHLQPPADLEAEVVEHEWELHEIVQARKGAEIVLCITPSLPRPRPHSPPLFTSAANDANGEYVVGLARLLVNAGTSSVDRLVHEFLAWISNHPRALSEDDLEVVRQTYLRWIDVASPVDEWTRGGSEDLPIHIAAAELGSSRALSVLHRYFSSTLAAGDDEDGEEMVESVVEIGTGERENDESAKLNRVQIKSARRRKKFEEDKKVSLSERTLSTLFGVACNSRQQDSNPLESLASEKSASVKITHQLPIGANAVPTSATPRHTLQACGRGLDLTQKNAHRRMEVRYRCLLSRADCQTSGDPTLQLHRQSLELVRARAAVNDGDKFLAYARDGGTLKITKGHIEKMLERTNESLHMRRMETLRASGDYEELESVLLNKYNWNAATEIDQVEHMLLLCECALKTGRSEAAFEWSMRTLQLVRDRKSLSSRHAKAILKRCVSVTEELLSSSAPLPDVQLKLTLSSGILADLLVVPPFNKSISLWTLLYELVRHVEGELTEQALRGYYAATEGLSRRMPCRSLMVLARAHRAVGEAEKCHRKGGRFLRFYLDELHRVVSGEGFARVCLGDGGRDAGSRYEDILTNVAEEVYQIICCVFTDKQWRGREEYAKHWSHLKWRADWPLALKIVALLMPQELPELYATEYDVDERFADVINAIFPFVLRVSEEEEQRLSHFLARRPVSLWPSTFATGGGLNSQELFKLATKEMMCEDPRGDLLTFADGVCEERQKILTTQSRVLYALSCWYYVNGGPSVEEELRCITSCLAICAPFLDDELQSAVWLVFGRRLTRRYSRLGDSSLLDRAEEWLFPFKVSLLLKRDFSEAHLDLATLIYQIRTRLRRYSSREGVSDAVRERIRTLTETFLPQCRMHCELAIRYNGRTENEEEEEWVGNINWISHYLMAKIAEKLEEPVAEVMHLYHLCALSLEREDYKYPSRISKERQEHFEPLEVYYKVHSYALKKVRELSRTASVDGTERTRTMLLEIEAHLRCFAHHGVAITVGEGKSAPEFYQRVSEQAPSQNSNFAQLRDEEVVKLTLDSMLEIVETQENIRTTCRKAFELIAVKFPHYKSIYRTAEEAYFNGDYAKAWKTLLEAFYGGAKKRSMQTPLSAENIIEIHRTDIERGGSLCYHTVKIMRLAAATAFKCAELERLVQLTIGLLPLKNEEDNSEKLSEHDVKAMRNDYMEKIVASVAEPAGDVKAVARVIELLQCLMKRFRNFREGYHDEASKLTQCLSKWTRRKNHLLEPPVEHVKPTQKSSDTMDADGPTLCPPSTTPASTNSDSTQINTSIEHLTRELTPLVLRLKSLPPKERNECLNMIREHEPEYFKKLELFAKLSSTIIAQSTALGTPQSTSTTEAATNNSEAQMSTDTCSTSSCPSVSSTCSPSGRMAVPNVSSSSTKRPQTPAAHPGNSLSKFTSSLVPSDERRQVSPAINGTSPAWAQPEYSAANAANKIYSSTLLTRPYAAGADSTPPSQSQSCLLKQSPVIVNREVPINPTRAQLLQSPIPSTSRFPTTPSNLHWEKRKSVELPVKRPLASRPTASTTDRLFQNRVSFLGIDGQPSPAKRLKPRTNDPNVPQRASMGGPVPELIVIEDVSPTKDLASPPTHSGHSPTYQEILNRLGVSQLGDVKSSRSITPQKSALRPGSAQALGSLAARPLYPLLAPFSQNTEHQSGVLQAQLDHIEKQRNFSPAQPQAQPPPSNSFGYRRLGPSPSNGTSTPKPHSQKQPLGSPIAISCTHLATQVNQLGQPTTIFHTTPAGTVQTGPGSAQTNIPPHLIAGSSQSTFSRK